VHGCPVVNAYPAGGACLITALTARARAHAHTQAQAPLDWCMQVCGWHVRHLPGSSCRKLKPCRLTCHAVVCAQGHLSSPRLTLFLVTLRPALVAVTKLSRKVFILSLSCRKLNVSDCTQTRQVAPHSSVHVPKESWKWPTHTDGMCQTHNCRVAEVCSRRYIVRCLQGGTSYLFCKTPFHAFRWPQPAILIDERVNNTLAHITGGDHSRGAATFRLSLHYMCWRCLWPPYAAIACNGT
jgi:hypothetical protein